MAAIAQTNRPLQVTTVLGENVLVVTGFRGHEEISNLFSFELDLIADVSAAVDFSKLVGSEVSLKIATPGAGGETQWRCLSGMCASFAQGDRDAKFSAFHAEIVPRVWLLTRKAQSRIFQHLSVPDILKAVLGGFECDYRLQGRYEPREYCVQYRETDFDFASRLMEEEGIFYLFTHGENGHRLVLGDTPAAHPEVPGLTAARYGMVEGGPRTADHVYGWRKSQTISPSRYSLRDHSFQQPRQDLEAKAKILDSVQAGSVEHHLDGQVNAPLEMYEYPGGYAVRFDGVTSSGGEQPDRLKKLFEENGRVAGLRMQTEAAEALRIAGSSGCRNFVAGHRFTLARHFDGDGGYVLISVAHDASLGEAYTSGGGDLAYSNTFTCLPVDLPFRPRRNVPKPVVYGVQTALVTGPPGEEIFTDKYGRVKVQFYWDRQGKKDADSSCWLRVGQSWAGKNWGSTQIPRIGQEVIVAFVEGNPDEPLVVGRVYNAETMPPYQLPDKKVVSGLKSNTHKGKGYNEISMDDTAGKEKMTVHAQYDMNATVGHDYTETIKNNAAIEITEGKYKHDVKTGTADYHVQAALTEKYDATQATTIQSDLTIKSTAGVITVSADAKNIYVHAATNIILETGQSKLELYSNGNINLTGLNIAINGSKKVYTSGDDIVSEAGKNHEVSGQLVKSTGTTSNTVQGQVVMLNP